jgi:TRAP-type C4-dicarboxylate transport system permease small subunit
VAWLERFTRRAALAGAALLLLCALLNGADIATRRVLSLNLAGMVDLTQLLVMASAFLCIPLTFARQAQIEVDFVTARLPVRAHAALRCATALACAGFMAAVTMTTARAALQALHNGDRSATLALPLTWYWLPVVAGSALAVLACLAVALAQGLRAVQAK